MRRFAQKAFRLLGNWVDSVVTSRASWIKKLCLTLLVWVIAPMSVVNIARAMPIDSTVTGLVLVNTIPDYDLFFLAQFVGAFPSQPLNYGATITPIGFTGLMSGAYGGQAVNIAYAASLVSASPTSQGFSWNSTGAFGGDAWNGTGTADFSLLTDTTFEVDYFYSMIVGSNAAEANVAISGTISSDLITYTSTRGILKINDIPIELPGLLFNSLSYFYSIGPQCPAFHCSIIENDIHHNILINSRGEGSTSGVGEVQFTGTIQVEPSQAIPEPSSITLLGAGILGLLSRKLRRHSLVG